MKIYEDKMLNNMNDLLGLISKENISQVKKWGVQKRSLFEWQLYLTEEVGELSKAIAELSYRDGSKEEVVTEAIQVVTLALKIAEMVKTTPI